jgi:hypothetical protein
LKQIESFDAQELTQLTSARQYALVAQALSGWQHD